MKRQDFIIVRFLKRLKFESYLEVDDDKHDQACSKKLRNVWRILSVESLL